MSAWTALNLEPEENLDPEIDESREIQVEEALKLYQNALKLHSQGPEYAEEATEAYEALLRSEIFRFPEAASEFVKDEVPGPVDHVSHDPHDDIPLVAASAVDGSPNSLLQIIYLSYKNYGQFLLDSVRDRAQSDDRGSANSADLRAILLEAGARALKQFAQALERDDSDLDLWRKTARISGVLSSHRLVRFCLESVIVTDENNSYDASDLLGLDELLAFEDLQSELKLLADDLSIIQAPRIEPKATVLKTMKRRLDPYPFLPSPSSQLHYEDGRQRPYHFVPEQKRVHSPTRTWTAVGSSIHRHLLEYRNSAVYTPGEAVMISIPPKSDVLDTHKEQGMDVDEKTPVITAGDDRRATDTKASEKEESPLDEDVHMDQNGEKSGHVSPGTQDVDDQLAAQLTNDIEETLQQGNNSAVIVAENEAFGEGQTASIPGRKRSSVTAGNEDPAETGRFKSKRLRARESNADTILHEEDVTIDQSRFYEEQLIELSQADDIVFTAVEQILDTLDVPEMAHLRQFRDVQTHIENSQELSNYTPVVTAMLDLQAALGAWTDDKGQAILVGEGTNDLDGIGSSRDVGLALFQEHTKPVIPQTPASVSFSEDDGLEHFIHTINHSWTYPEVSALQWLEALILPKIEKSTTTVGNHGRWVSTYTRSQWPPVLKELVVKLILSEEEYLTRTMQDRLDGLETRLLNHTKLDNFHMTDVDLCHTHMAQTLFELHLDVYYAITNPSSEVDKAIRTQQRDRLLRWNDIASGFLSLYSQQDDLAVADSLALRYLYAATLHAIKAEDAIQDHIIICLKDLQRLLERANNISIFLPNNAAMPEISVTAVGQEISRLSTLDFFMAMFNSDNSDPVAIIEGLEPILEHPFYTSQPFHGTDDASTHLVTNLSPQAQELVHFLEKGDASLTLFLWRRLRDAYKAIDYPPKIVSCYLRSLQIVVKELLSSAHLDMDTAPRQFALLKRLKYLDDVMLKLMSLVLSSPDALDCVDVNHLKDSLTAVTRLAFILHSFAVFDDGIRIGQHQGPPLKSASSNRAFDKVRDKLRDMSMRLWTLLYVLLRDGMAQNNENFPNETEERANYLRFVHNAMGLRGYCKHSNKVFLKLMKREFLSMKSWQECETDFAQVLFDMYGLKFGYGIGDYDHNCTPETLDKKTANQIIPFVMSQARRLNFKDLGKSELKGTLEKMQQMMGTYKTTPTLSFNKRVINQYLKSPINPAELYSCIKGIGDLPTRPVISDSALVAETGWYFLQGYLALGRYKSVKRVSPTSTDDLDTAAAFFRQDLDHDIEKWETWYRLAQTYDLKVEDDLLWTAEKINNHRGELATLQRNAIHCYSMAVAASLRTAETSPEVAATMSDMYTDFGIRLYASSREPLSMNAFNLDNYDRHYSDRMTGAMYKAKPFPEMKIYSVWNLAAHFFRRALVDKPKKWITHYHLGKCLWKMLCNTGDPRTIRSKPGVDDLLEVLTEAVDNLPEKKDSRTDPILEPHIKLVSIVHKLVRRGMLDTRRASEILQVSKWAKKAHLAEDEEDGWEPYVLSILKYLGQADKANWHHRIAARAAHVIYDGNESDLAAALGAKHELTQQIFTKTMTLQVWKPENERAGRHFVYTTRYVMFFIGILYQLNDRPNLDMLARRIRRKPGDYLNHGKLWDAICGTYVNLLRKIGKLQPGMDEEAFKSLNSEEFAKRSAKVESWAHDPDTSSATIDLLRDAIELKKLNNSLMKGSSLDDLIADAYTRVYQLYYEKHPESETQTDAMGLQVNIVTPAGSATHDSNETSIGRFDGTSEPHPNGPVPTVAASQPVDSSTISSTATAQKTTRSRPVSRREIIRRAEAVISKATSQSPAAPKPLTSTPAKILRPVIEIRTSAPPTSTPVSSKKGSGEAASIAADTSSKTPSSTHATTLAKDLAAEDHSVPVSPKAGDDDEDADDESTGGAVEESGSELSDLDEEQSKELEEKAKLMFPGLLAGRTRKDSMSSNDSSSGNGADEQTNVDGDEAEGPEAVEGEDEPDADEDGDEDGDTIDQDNDRDHDHYQDQDQDQDRDEVMADVEQVLE